MTPRSKKRKLDKDGSASDLEVTASPSSSKKPRKQTESTSEVVRPTAGPQPRKRKKSAKKPKALTAYQEAYSMDTPAEKRARNKAVRELVGNSSLSSKEIEPRLARYQEEQELRRLQIENMVSLKRVPFSKAKVDKVDTLDEDDLDSSDDSRSESDAGSDHHSFLPTPSAPKSANIDKPASERMRATQEPKIGSEAVATQPSGNAILTGRSSLPANTDDGRPGRLKPPFMEDSYCATDPLGVHIHPDRRGRIRNASYNSAPPNPTKSGTDHEGELRRQIIHVELDYIQAKVTRGRLRRIARKTGAVIHVAEDSVTDTALVAVHVIGSYELVEVAKHRIVQSQHSFRRQQVKKSSQAQTLADALATSEQPEAKNQTSSVTISTRSRAEIQSNSQPRQVTNARDTRLTAGSSHKISLKMGEPQTASTNASSGPSRAFSSNQSSPEQALSSPVVATHTPLFSVPSGAAVIKIEDDSDNDYNTVTLSNPATQSHEHDIQAIFDAHRSQNNVLQREIRTLNYIIGYMGISDLKKSRIQERCNNSRNGTWETNCRAVLGHDRRETR